MKPAISICGLVLLLGLLAEPDIAASVAQRFALPGHGDLVLSIPDTWRSTLKQPTGAAPPTLEIEPRGGAQFRIELTPIGGFAPDTEAAGDTMLRKMVAAAAKSVAAQAVETSLTIRELSGPNGRGYYFVATDRAPAPGEWKILTQGVIRKGTIALAFTILTNDDQDETAKSALEMVRMAAWLARDEA